MYISPVAPTTLLLLALLPVQSARVVTGRVVLLPDSVPVRGVRVGVSGTAVAARTDARGAFRLTEVPDAGVSLTASGPGIRPDTVYVPADRDTVTITVAPAPVMLDPVVVTETRGGIARARFEATAQPSLTSLSPAEIAGTPGLLEADILRTVQLLPGTVARNDYSIGYNVRGGESDQNLILVDGITIFNPSHLAGLFSTFDANAVARADFHTAGFPARYPGRLSSVLDLSLRTGDPAATRVSGQVSLLSSKFLVEGPLGSGTWFLSGRRTYADAVVAAFSSEVLPYYFTDVLGKTVLPLGGGALSFTGYWGRDVLDFNLVKAAEGREAIDLAFDWGNALAGLTWRHAVGRGFAEHRASVSTFSTTLGLLPDLARFDNRVRLLSAGSQLVPWPDGRHDLRAGIDVSTYAMDYLVRSPSLGTTFLDTEYHPAVFALALEDRWRATPWLIVHPGLRAEHVTGADRTVLSPRGAAKVFLTDDLALSASAGRYHQVVHSIRDQEIPITIFEFWIGADEFVPVARSDHLAGGIEYWPSSGLELKAEGWRKTFRDLVTPNRAQDLRVRGDEFIPATGDAHGVDVLVRRHAGRVRGWLGYSYVRTIRRAEGVEFPPAHDRRHTVNVVMQAPGPLGADLSVRWGYGSPLPYTGFRGEWHHRVYDATRGVWEDSREEPLAAAINGERFPPYHRLDVGLRWQFEKFGGQWEPYLQVANAYNRQNVFVYFFDYQDAPPTRTGVSQLPVLPTFGIEFTF